MKNIVIFASGSGSNAEAIINHFKSSNLARIVAVFTNKADAGIIVRAKNHNIPFEVFTKAEFSGAGFVDLVQSYQPELIVLAGFLLKIPENFVKAFPNKIINIHPALLPKYGGKGMYGTHVHQAVFENRESASGMTIHYVNEDYDQGSIIFQESTDITTCTSAEEIAKKVLTLEHKNYPKVIEKLIAESNPCEG